MILPAGQGDVAQNRDAVTATLDEDGIRQA
jgi:hypothetical protein